MRFLSVCSGIEAASVAWHPIGWKALAFSEIEAFPRSVLAHHYPDVPLHGDFTVLRDQQWIADADVLVGGTPCQAFSVAGLRQSLQDDRGNLTLEYVRLADAVDDLRRARGEQPAIVVWENVPGVLSVKDNAFGCFLAALVGNDAPVVHTGKRWTNAGLVIGPKRAAAWRVLDAQYFGVAQRRRRVFVVASARDGFDPAEVLFEREGVPRNTPPSRSEGKAAPTIPARSSAGGGLGTDFDCDGGLIEQPYNVANCLTQRMHKGINAEKDGTGRGAPLVSVQVSEEVADTLAVGANQTTGFASPSVVAFHPTQDPISSTDGTTHALGCGSSGGQASVAVATSYTIRADAMREGIAKTPSADAEGRVRLRDPGMGVYEELAPTIDTGQAHGVAMTNTMAVRRLTPRECERLQGFPDDYTLIPVRNKPAADGPRYKALGNSMAVPVMHWIGKRIQKHVETIQ